MRFCILFLFATCSSFLMAEPEITYDIQLAKSLKLQPCTQAKLPLTNDSDVKAAVECDYPKLEIIKFTRTAYDRDIAEVKLYKKGELNIINVHYSTGLTIIFDQEK